MGGKRRRTEYHLRKGGGRGKGRDKSTEGVVYMTKSRGPDSPDSHTLVPDHQRLYLPLPP